MAKLVWDEVGKRTYETGVNKGVLFLYQNSKYGTGVAWSGLTGVNESPSGAEATALYADNIKYLNLISAEDFSFTIEAYTYPEEFGICDGTAEATAGVFVGQQPRTQFGFSFQTKIGNDADGDSKGYKIHLCYGCYAAATDKTHATINDSPEAQTFSWTVSTTPVNVGDLKPTAHLVIDSTKVDAAKLAAFEAKLYGSESAEAAFMMPDEVVAMFKGE